MRETRKIWCDSDNAQWAASFDGKNPFASLRSFFCVERTEKHRNGTVSCEVHYYMSSLDISCWKAKDILALVRGHGSVENCLHWVKDRWRDEDRHYLSMPGLSEKFTCLLNRSLNVLQFLQKGKEPLTAVAARVRDNLKIFLKLLGILNSNKK